jgi:hypothetical protein
MYLLKFYSKSGICSLIRINYVISEIEQMVGHAVTVCTEIHINHNNYINRSTRSFYCTCIAILKYMSSKFQANFIRKITPLNGAFF